MIGPIRKISAPLVLACFVALACGGGPDGGEEEPAEAAETAQATVAGEESDADEKAVAAARAAAREADTSEALSRLKRATDFLEEQESFRVEVALEFDVVQTTGKKLEFGSARRITLRRPDRMRIDVRERDADERTIRFDGEQLSIAFDRENAYLAVKKPGTLVQIIDYMVDELDAPLPFGDFLHPDFYAEVVDDIEYGLVVEDSTIDGHLCDHLAFVAGEADFQIWIDQGERPLPRRFLIDYKKAPGRPQFEAQARVWELAAETPESLFAFTPPERAERLLIRAVSGPGGAGRSRPNVSRRGPASYGSIRQSGSFSEGGEPAEQRGRRRVGASLTAASFRALTCTPTIVAVRSVTYYSCAGSWYRRYYQKGAVTYVVVNAPVGY